MLGGVSIGGHLKRLQEDYNLIAKFRPFATGEGSKSVRYELADIFLRFWFRYIHKNQSIVEIENWKLLRKIITDDYCTYTGDILERNFRQKMMESMSYRAIGNWWDPRNKENQCEIDILALTANNQTLEAYEVKRNIANYKEALLQYKLDHFLAKNKEFKKYETRVKGISMEDM